MVVCILLEMKTEVSFEVVAFLMIVIRVARCFHFVLTILVSIILVA